MPVAFIGGAGGVIGFLLLFVATIILSFYLFSYTGHCFLVVVEQTGEGNNEVVWPNDILLDWIWRGVPLAWVALVWLSPLGLALKLMNPDVLSKSPELALLLVGLVLWLGFPIGVLSSMTSDSRWAAFRPSVCLRLSRHPGATLTFYAASAVVVAVGLGVWIPALVWSSLFLPVAAFVGAGAVLLYARLLGRLAWIIRGEERKKRPRSDKTRSTPDDTALAPPPKPSRPARSKAVPEGAYGFAEEEDVPASTATEPESSARKTGYDFAEEGEKEEEVPGAIRPAEDLLGKTRRRVEQAQERLAITKPPRSFRSGVWGFPWYATNVQTLVTLAALAIVEGILLRSLLGNAFR
jgi:hypothetical protein